MSRLARAADRLETIRNRVASIEVTYVRHAGGTLTALATPGESEFETDDDSGGRIEYRTNDFLISASELVYADDNFEPAGGDQIHYTRGGVLKRFEVMSRPGFKPWRFTDSFQNTYRIHTKEINA